AADGKNPRECPSVQPQTQVFRQSAEAVAEPDDLHAAVVQRRFAYAANGRIESGTVSAGGDDPDAFYFFHARRDKSRFCLNAGKLADGACWCQFLIRFGGEFGRHFTSKPVAATTCQRPMSRA